jgi:hypothetical protein
VSYLGFKTYAIALSTLRFEDTLRVYLKSEVLQLAEVTVRPHSDSGKIILKEALKRLKKNFPTKMHQLNAFYREKVQNRDDYSFTRLIEGMVDIQDNGIQSNPDVIRIRLNEFRKSNNIAKQTWGQWAWKKVFGEHNNLYNILLQDPVRIHLHNVRTAREGADDTWYSNSRSYWLGEMLLDSKTSIYIANMTSYNGEEVYHLKFKYTDYHGSIYINKQDFGIHHIDYYCGLSAEDLDENYHAEPANTKTDYDQTRREEVKKQFANMQYQGLYLGKLRANYQKINGKYYLAYLEWLTMGDFRKSNVNEGKTTGSYSTCMLMVNGIQTDKKEIDKVKVRQSVSKDENINNLRMKYNENFWRNYNVLLATPLENKVIRDLTFEESLEQQFKKNQ